MSSNILYLTYSICIIGIIADLSSIYFINNIWAFRKHKFIQSRSPTLTYSVLWIFFSLLILAVANACIYIFIDFQDVIYFFIVNDAIQYGCTFAYATRAWILFYHVEWSYESVNHIWRTQLAEAEAHVSKEVLHSASLNNDDIAKSKFEDGALFWINYRDSLGNYKKVFPMTMCLLLPLFIFLLDILPYIVFDINHSNDNRNILILIRIVNILCYLFIFILILILIRRIHKISDKYGIGFELKNINICFAVFIIIGRIINGILIIVLNNNNKLFDIMIFISSICSITSILCSIYIASFFVLRKLFAGFAGNETIKEFQNKRHTLQKIVTIGTKKQMENNENNNNINDTILTLNKLLSTQYGFETFTQFLISELSVENILFLVEVKQYKACCRKYHKSEQSPLPNLNGKTNTNTHDYSDIKKNVMSLRPTTTTRSKPNVFKSKSIMNVEYVPSNSILQSLNPYDYAMYLYIKYIIDGSDLQINIPSKTRKNLTKFLIKTDKTDIILMDDYTDQMFKLYDKAWEQIHTLIKSDSYSRFKYTKEYNDLCIRAKEEDDKKTKENAYANEFLNKPKPSILDWTFNETVMISNYSPPNTSIPEDAEVEMHDYEEELQKLNSINKYDTKTKSDVSINDEDAMDVLNDIPSYDDDQDT